MKTVIISDLHFGHPSGRDLLVDPLWQQRLLDIVEPDTRLVLLGDVLQQVDATAIARARPVIEILAAAIPDGELVVTAGNHDHQLIDQYISPMVDPGLEQRMLPSVAGDWAGALYGGLPVPTTIAYPGVWLGDDVYAWHGHYGDIYSTFPTPERLIAKIGSGEPKPTVRAFERRIRSYPWLHSRLPRPQTRHRTNLSDRLSTVHAPAVDLALPVVHQTDVNALWKAIDRLDIMAPVIISGHTHNAGSFDRDEQTVWNPGSWLGLFNWEVNTHYAPGAIVIEHGQTRLHQFLEPFDEETADET